MTRMTKEREAFARREVDAYRRNGVSFTTPSSVASDLLAELDDTRSDLAELLTYCFEPCRSCGRRAIWFHTLHAPTCNEHVPRSPGGPAVLEGWQRHTQSALIQRISDQLEDRR